MSARNAWLSCALAALTCWSCNDDVEPLTQVVVVVRSDLDLGTQLTHLRLELHDPSDEREIHRGQLIPLAEEDPEDGEQTLPLSFGIVPQAGDASLPFLLKVRGYGPLGANDTDIEVVRESVLTGFLPGETTVIQVFLGKQCLQNLCENMGGGTLMSCDYRSGTCGEIVFIPPVRADGDPGGVLVPEGCGEGFEARDGDCVDLDECELDEAACGDGATCDNTSGGYACVCEDDRVVEHGEDCEDSEPLPPGVCAGEPCQAPGECVAQGEDFVCTCPSGYEENEPGETTCTNIDECEIETDACDPRARCVDEPGGYRCEDCGNGFEDPAPGDTECINIDECELDTDGCEPGLRCDDTDGSFQCSGCGVGFVDPAEGETSCVAVDIDPCDPDPCDSIATCMDTGDGFQCDCPSTHVDPPPGEVDCAPIAEGCVVRVRPGGADGSDGSTWALAKATISAALDVPDVCEVWVAAGEYEPTRNAANTPSSGRDATFLLREDVAVYGGFAGSEEARNQRNVLAHPTVLSGNVGAAGVSDNVYHVVTGADGATLDGFFIIGGYAQEGGTTAGDIRNHGGGMLNDGLEQGISVDNVVFVANRANYGGGAANRFGTVLDVDSSVFLWNHGSSAGGGVLASSMVSTTNFPIVSITSTTFFGNTGTYGVGAWSMQSRMSVRNSTFQANVTAASGSSGALDFFTAPPSGTTPNSVVNSTFIGNTGVKGASLWVDSNAPEVIGCSFVNNVSNTSATIATRELSPPARPRVLNCLFWNNTRQGASIEVDVSAEEGGAPFADASCAVQNLDGFGDGNANVTIPASPSPLGTILPSGIAYLDPSSACVDSASSIHAAAASIPWSTLTTAADGDLDTVAPDAGRHVSPDAVTISAIAANGTTLSWTANNARGCAWIRKDDTIPHGVAPSTTSVSHGAASGTGLVVICAGDEGEPAVAGVIVP